ncbi:unnamed protein product [Rhodiola kirilowii]
MSSNPISLLLLLLFLTPITPQHLTSDETTTLLSLKTQLEHPPSLSHWSPSSTSPCNWPEITCNDSNTTVTGLNLKDKNITHPIPPILCNLKNLTFLDLSYNFIPNTFPNFILTNCTNLHYLDLSMNYFIGPIPSHIDQLTQLTYLDVGANNFSGDIPSSIGKLKSLKTLYMYQNEFNGTYPAEIGELESLEVLGLAYNDKFVPASVPVNFSKLKKLRYLWMTDTNLIGAIPESIVNCSALEHLDLSSNRLTGLIPDGIFQLQNLTILYLYHNELSGQIARNVSCFNLVELDLGINELNGSVPDGVGNLRILELLNLFSNRFTGEVLFLAELTALKNIRLFRNNFSGLIPQDLGSKSLLEAFEVSDNQFTGPLPKNLCAGGVLTGVVAFSNRLSGEIPESLAKCTSLRTVQLYNNSLTGRVPKGLWSLENMSMLMLSDNMLTGELPEELAWNVTRLEISNNRFSGRIPVGSGKWMNLIVFQASNNEFSGEIPNELTNLSRINTLALDGNNLSGALPTEIRSWKMLNALNLSRNHLAGEIHASLASLPDLIYLDLSENKLSGEIPTQLGNLRLNSLNLSSNKLSGQVPYQFENPAYDSSFLHNPSLCSRSSALNIPVCDALSGKGHNRLSSGNLALLILGIVVAAVMILVLALYLKRDYKKKKFTRELAAWKLTSFQRLSFTEANIISSMVERNLIGCGGSGQVYKVSTGRLGEFVAVKRIWSSKVDRDTEKEFLAEVEILSCIKHCNIVKLLCCVSSESSKVLVYEYLENQSLDKWIHKRRRDISVADMAAPVVLDWPTRLQIALGAAQGLCYMHHDCSPSVIHRDVKSSNILLDAEFKARIADFGLAKILAKDGQPNTMSSIAGSFGYFAPEFAYTRKVNEKIDVYSFGVVLLELVTGREPSDGDEHTCLAEWAWKHYSNGKSVESPLDQDVVAGCYSDEMATIFNLGLVCTNSLPAMRPSMKEVTQILRKCATAGDPEGKKVVYENDIAPLLGKASYVSSYTPGVIDKLPAVDDSSCLVNIG